MQQNILRQPPLAKHRHRPCYHQQQKQQLLLPAPCRHERRGLASVAHSSGDPDNATINSKQQGAHNAKPSAAPAPSQSGIQGVLSAATRELGKSVGLLKDAAGVTFIPGYTQSGTNDRSSNSSSSNNSSSSSSRSRSSSSGSGRVPVFKLYSSMVAAAETSSSSAPSSGQSIPQRLERLLTGRFIRELQGNSGHAKADRQSFDAKLAAIQFELQKAEAAQQPEQQARDAVNGPVIDVVPEAATAAVAGPEAVSTVSYASSSASAGATAGTDSESRESSDAAKADSFPATTQMLMIVTWAVFLLQWWPALPQLWLVVKDAGLLHALAVLLFAYPDTPVTQTLCSDFTKFQAGNITGLLTSGLLHSGLAATWWYTKTLSISARWIELGMGSMDLLATYAIAALCASLAHLLAGTTLVGVSGAGAVVGVYTAWTILALQHLKEELPARGLYASLGLVLLLSIGLGIVQPAVGMASIVGGVLGGAMAVKLASPLAAIVKWGLAIPFLVLLFLLRMAIDGMKVLLLAIVPVVVAVVQGTLGVVQAVRRL